MIAGAFQPFKLLPQGQGACKRLLAILVSFVLVMLVQAWGREIRRDPVELRIRMLYVGDALEMPDDPTVGYLRADPAPQKPSWP